MNTKRTVAVIAVVVMAFAAFAAISPSMGADGGSASSSVPGDIVYLHGDITSRLEQTTEQTVIIDADLCIKDGGSLLIAGNLIVKEGVIVTIDSILSSVGPASSIHAVFEITGDAEINGDIVSKSKHGLLIQPSSGKKVVMNGTVNVFGDISWVTTNEPALKLVGDIAQKNLIVNGSIIVGSNGYANINQVYFGKDSNLTILGRVSCDQSTWDGIYVAGKVSVDNDACLYGCYMKLVIAGTTADINLVAAKGTYYITDKGMFAYSYGGVQYYVALSESDMPGYAPAAPLSGLAVAKLNSYAVDTNVSVNSIRLDEVSNLRITETVTTFMDYDVDNSKNMMCADTKMILSSIDSTKTVVDPADNSSSSYFEVYSPSATVCLESMTLEGIRTWVNLNSKVYILGNVTIAKPIDPTEYRFNGDLTVEGLLVLKNDQDIILGTSGGKLLAAKYTIKNTDNTIDTCYTTLKKAIDNGATDIKLYGEYIIDKDLTLPAPIKVTTDMYSYPSLKVEEGAVFTIADGAKFNAEGSYINVYGSMIIENYNYGITIGNNYLWADLKIQEDKRPYVKYCNLKIGFEEAKAGDTLTLYRPNGYYGGTSTLATAIISEDLTLPSGVKLENGGFFISVVNGCRFTIDGELCISETNKLKSQKKVGSSTDNKWNTETSKVNQSGEVEEYSVLAIGENGVIKFDISSPSDPSAVRSKANDLYQKYKVEGAYFANDTHGNSGSKCCISSIPYAFDRILDSLGNRVDIFGTVSLDNIKVSGNENERMMVVITDGTHVTMNNFVFSYGKLIFEGDLDDQGTYVEVTGDIGTANGKIIFDGTAVIRYLTVFEDQFINDSMNLIVRGMDETLDKDYDPDAYDVPADFGSREYTSISGTVFLKNVCYSSNNSQTDLTISDMIFEVPSGSSLFIMNWVRFLDVELRVAGDLTVTNTGTFVMTNFDTTLSVTGTFTAERSDDSAARVEVINMIVGGTAADFDKLFLPNIIGTATVKGAGSFENFDRMTLTVFSGATVSADVLVNWMAEIRNTEFYLDDTLIYTMYAGAGRDIPIAITKTTGSGTDQKTETEYNLIPALENGMFNAWKIYDEKTKTYKAIVGTQSGNYGKEVWVGQAGYTKVYADISKDIYFLYVVADEGIDNIYFDGILMFNLGNRWFAQVEAGSHALGYTIANGYSGSAVITTIDGKKTAGTELSFIVNDDKYNAAAGEMVITLSGIQKSGIDIDPDTHPEQSSGLTVTEILLIAVVVIIVVMAVVLILRLNRS